MNVEIRKGENNIINLKKDEGEMDGLHYFFYKDGEPFKIFEDDSIQLKIWKSEHSGVGATIRKGEKENEGIGSIYKTVTGAVGKYKAEIYIKNPFKERNETFNKIIFNIEE